MSVNGDKIMTLVASALAGGDCIDEANGLRTIKTAAVLGCTVKAPSTLGTFRWGYARQLDRVSRELLARAWAAGTGPGAALYTQNRVRVFVGLSYKLVVRSVPNCELSAGRCLCKA